MSLFPWKGRDWTLEETSDGPLVVIPSPCLWPIAAFMAVWLSGWVMGEISAAKQLWQIFRGASHWAALFPAGFLLFWLAGWTAGGVFAWAVFLFSLDGRELVFVREGTLRVRLQTFLGLHWTWTYDLAAIAPPRVLGAETEDGSPEDGERVRALGALNLSYIEIVSGARKWRLGLGLPEQRARDLLYTLQSRFGLPRERR